MNIQFRNKQPLSMYVDTYWRKYSNYGMSTTIITDLYKI